MIASMRRLLAAIPLVSMLASGCAASSDPGSREPASQTVESDLIKCDPGDPKTWHTVSVPMEHADSVIGVIVSGERLSWDGTCNVGEESYCRFQREMVESGNVDHHAFNGWIATKKCELHAYTVSTVLPPGANESTWPLVDAYSDIAPVYARGIPQAVPVYVWTDCEEYDSQGACYRPQVRLSRELTKEAVRGMVAGDPGNPPLVPCDPSDLP